MFNPNHDQRPSTPLMSPPAEFPSLRLENFEGRLAQATTFSELRAALSDGFEELETCLSGLEERLPKGSIKEYMEKVFKSCTDLGQLQSPPPPSAHSAGGYAARARAAKTVSELQNVNSDFENYFNVRFGELAERRKDSRTKFKETMAIVASDRSRLMSAMAGTQSIQDAIRLRSTIENARLAFRWAMLMIDEDYWTDDPLERDSVGEWWPSFRRIVLEKNKIPGDAAPLSVYELCRSSHLAELEKTVAFIHAEEQEIANEIASISQPYREQAAAEKSALVSMTSTLGQLSLEQSDDKKRAKDELLVLLASRMLQRSRRIMASYEASIAILNDKDAFALLEMISRAEESNWNLSPDGRRLYERAFLFDALQDGEFNLPSWMSTAIRNLYAAVNDPLPAEHRTQMPEALKRQVDVFGVPLLQTSPTS